MHRYGWHMRDSEVVASIVAGDPGGLALAYDRYADPLYKYCRSILSDPADAADAVLETFVIAAFRLDGLHDTERLRAWLYAVARNVCLRTMRARRTMAASAPVQAPDVTAAGGLPGDDTGQADLLALIEDATWGLNPAEREAIGLQLRQGLEPAEIAAVLGMSRNHVNSLLARARDQLLACLGVLLVGRATRDECHGLASMLSGWDGHLTVPLRKRVHRHIERCAVCTARRAFELRPAMLLGLSPGAAIIAAAAESLRVAGGPPTALRAHTLALAAGRGPGAIADRAAVLGRAGSFGRDGFPKPAHASMAGLPRADGQGARRVSAWERATVAAGAVLAATVAATVALALTGNPGHGTRTGGKPPVSASAVVAPGTSGAPTSPAPARHRASSAASTAKPTGSASPSPTSTAATSPAPTSPPATSPSATTSPTPGKSWTPGPSPTATRPSPTPSPSAGTLNVSPQGGQLTIPQGGTASITLTAQGGPVDWSIAVSAGSGQVSAQPSSGSLAKNQNVTVTIQARKRFSGRQLTVNPGGTVFTLVTNGNGQSGGAGQLSVLGARAWVALPSGRIVFWLYLVIRYMERPKHCNRLR
jgi:RNA polymerase sigma factor (sigma-70 family)